MTDTDPKARLLSQLAAARRRPIHPYGGLVDTEAGVRYHCLRCGLLTAEQWAQDCRDEEAGA